MNGRKSSRGTAASFVKYAVLTLYAAACLYPFIWMIGTSLKSQMESLRYPSVTFPKESWHFETYIEVWNKLNFAKYFTNSMLVSTTAVIVAVLIYSLMGFALARIDFKGKNLIFAGYIALILVPGLTVQIPLYINMVSLGLGNTFAGLVLPMINGAGPFAVFLFRNYFLSLSKELFEAAKLDGSSLFGIYARIFLPLALPVVGTIAVMNFIGTWNGIQWPMIILRDRELFTLPMAVMYLDQSAFKQWNVLMAGSLYSVVPVIVVFVLLQKSYIRGLTSGAIKG